MGGVGRSPKSTKGRLGQATTPPKANVQTRSKGGLTDEIRQLDRTVEDPLNTEMEATGLDGNTPVPPSQSPGARSTPLLSGQEHSSGTCPVSDASAIRVQNENNRRLDAMAAQIANMSEQITRFVQASLSHQALVNQSDFRGFSPVSSQHEQSTLAGSCAVTASATAPRVIAFESATSFGTSSLAAHDPPIQSSLNLTWGNQLPNLVQQSRVSSAATHCQAQMGAIEHTYASAPTASGGPSAISTTSHAYASDALAIHAAGSSGQLFGSSVPSVSNRQSQTQANVAAPAGMSGPFATRAGGDRPQGQNRPWFDNHSSAFADHASATYANSERSPAQYAEPSHFIHNNQQFGNSLQNLPCSGLYQRKRLIDLPSFSGRPEEWPAFISTFRSTTEAYGYSDIENHARLQKCLVGEAKQLVQSVLVFPHGVADVLTSLKSAYGCPKMLVRAQVEAARKLPVIPEDRLDMVRMFAIQLKNFTNFLDFPDTRRYLADSSLLEELVVKLPRSKQLDWTRHARRIVPEATIKDLADWLQDLSDIISDMIPMMITQKPSANRKILHLHESEGSENERPHSDETRQQTRRFPLPKCNFCDRTGHAIKECRSFLKLSIDDRLSQVSKLRLCFGCMEKGHLLPHCATKQRCGRNGCGKYHSMELHKATDSNPFSVGKRNHTSGPVSHAMLAAAKTLSCRVLQSEPVLLYRVLPVELFGPMKSIKTFALLDEGSSISLIDDATARRLQLNGPEYKMKLQWLGEDSTSVYSKLVKIGIRGLGTGCKRFELSNVRTISKLSLPIQTVHRDSLINYNSHLSTVDFADYRNAKPTILLGLEHHFLGVPINSVTSNDRTGLVAAQTELGWVVYGSGDTRKLPNVSVLHVQCDRSTSGYEQTHSAAYELLNDLVRNHFSTESFGSRATTEIVESDESRRARSLLQSTTRRLPVGFETGLLWKRDEVKLPNNYEVALRRLIGVERKMSQSTEYAEQYRKQIAHFIDSGYVRKLSAKEASARSDRTWWLPHFAVKNPRKPGKFRIVFDAAAEFNKTSLNSLLLTGPDENTNMVQVLMKFRVGSIGVTADIKEMFSQVRIREEDQDAQRFLWRDGNSNSDPEQYKMTVMTFGSTCSPASAQFVKNINATEFSNQMPEAADIIINNHYVDDLVASFRSADEAIRICRDVVRIHNKANFELRGFASNSMIVRQHLGGEPTGTLVDLEPEPTSERVLGMTWNTADDTFRFRTIFVRVDDEVIEGRKKPSKRQILSTAMSIFDPFGLISNFVLIAKLIVQDLWAENIGWDDPVPDAIADRWESWRSKIVQTHEVRVPRCYSVRLHEAKNIQLHLFADASEAAFAAVAFWRITYENNVELSFALGKCRCAPLQILTIPRLELQAAVLASRMLVEIQKTHQFAIDDVYVWTDSATVVKWLRSDQRRYKPFVAFRVAEALENSKGAKWRWLPTTHNVADDGTRPRPSQDYDPNGRWLRGPDWLKADEDDWPAEDAITQPSTIDHELRHKFVGIVVMHIGITIDYSRFSRFTRLCRVIAWTNRFISNSRTNKISLRELGELSSDEVHYAERSICWSVQREIYGAEIKTLQDKKQLHPTSTLFQMKPMLDDDGIIRIHGRTDFVDSAIMNHESKRPIVMPKDHYVTKLIVAYYHQQNAHQLIDATIASIRVKFWIPSLRTLVTSVIRSCMVCRIRNAKPSKPTQGQLPPDRLAAYERPFTYTGLDFFGPLWVTIGRRREKRWISLFTCMTVRAVHLEIAADLSTDACLLCIRNLCNLRGVPSVIRCDNGTNFVGARNEMTKDGDFMIDADDITRQLSIKNIRWVMNCPGNPEAGGAWERLVQSVKRVLAVTLKEEAPRPETLRAMLLEAANLINSRPLTHLQVTPDDPEPITPNHFLIGGPNNVMAVNPSGNEPRCTRKQWLISRDLTRRFWRQWIDDYLPELTMRSRHYPERAQIKTGDLVLVCDENMLRGTTKRGRVLEAIAGPDGIVRTAVIKTTEGTTRRPTTKLAVLNVGPLQHRTGPGVANCLDQ